MSHTSISYLRSPEAVRERAQNIFDADRDHFEVDLARLRDVVERVEHVTRNTYPSGTIPIHGRFRHFGEQRLRGLDERLGGLDTKARARAHIDLVMTSVLLDAGAGASWRYREAESGTEHSRSEGLAIASFHMFLDGAFSHTGDLNATAEGLERLDQEALARGFQVTTDNPLVGLRGRCELLNALGQAISRHPELFGTNPRPGHLIDHISGDAREILMSVLTGLGSIWPPRTTLDGETLGDVWRHPKAGGDGLVPFHKLSQWLTYSLVEPFERTGISIENLDALTGLAEYRNGGLFVDCDVLSPKHDAVVSEAHKPDSEIIVEWRALTVVLLDHVARLIQRPLAQVLEGGTWRAGREVAREKREDGSPPIRVESDGTVF